MFKQKDRKYHPVFCYLSLKAFLSSATFKSAIGHVRAVTAVCSDNTTATVYDMVTTRFRCWLIAFFLFIFFVHVSPHHYSASFHYRETSWCRWFFVRWSNTGFINHVWGTI